MVLETNDDDEVIFALNGTEKRLSLETSFSRRYSSRSLPLLLLLPYCLAATTHYYCLTVCRSTSIEVSGKDCNLLGRAIEFETAKWR